MDERYERSPDAAFRTIQGKTFVVSASVGSILQLNELGGRVWDLLDGQRTATDIAGIIASEFEVTEPVADADVAAFVRTLEDRGVARPRPEAG